MVGIGVSVRAVVWVSVSEVEKERVGCSVSVAVGG